MTARGTKKKPKRRKPSPRKAAPRRSAKAASRSDTLPGRKTSLGRKTLFDLPPLELECMKAVWTLAGTGSEAEGVTVREIGERVSQTHRRLAYTTVETIMDRLTRKHMVTREKKGRAHRYRAVYRIEQARSEGLATLLEHFFDGSRGSLRSYLAGGPMAAPRTLPPVSSPSKETVRREPARPSPRSRRKVPQPQLETELL